MKTIFGTAMRKAAQLTQSQQVIEATRVIQRALDHDDFGLNQSKIMNVIDSKSLERDAGGVSTFPHPALAGRTPAPSPDQQSAANLAPIEPEAGARPADAQPSAGSARLRDATTKRGLAARAARPLGEVLTLLRQARQNLAPGAKPRTSPVAPPVPLPEGAAFLTKTFSCAAGSRDYKVYVPGHAHGRKRPLLIMLHGCTQDPNDFAAGTGMNLLAEDQGFIVAYPGQAAAANHSLCWNWFDPEDQLRDAGEPSIIAGITRAIMAEFDIDPSLVYVAGLSAGGAMALIMSATYPELYAAAGVHSGLAYGSATDLPSAFAAMAGNVSPVARAPRRPKRARKTVRTIVFHGESDKTVHPSNAGVVVADARACLASAVEETQHGRSAGGRAYTRTLISARGVLHVEHWAIEGLGHGWSGGRPEGSFTDPDGPDASREMVRFFLGDSKAGGVRATVLVPA